MKKTTSPRARKPLAAEEFVEYMTIKTMEHLATMPSEEKKARLEAFHRGVAEARATHARAARTRVSRASSRGR
jgi:hypothetical protein